MTKMLAEFPEMLAELLGLLAEFPKCWLNCFEICCVGGIFYDSKFMYILQDDMSKYDMINYFLNRVSHVFLDMFINRGVSHAFCYMFDCRLFHCCVCVCVCVCVCLRVSLFVCVHAMCVCVYLCVGVDAYDTVCTIVYLFHSISRIFVFLRFWCVCVHKYVRDCVCGVLAFGQLACVRFML